MEAGQTTYAPPRPPRPPRDERDRRYRLTHRLLPVAVLAGLAFVGGFVVGALHAPAEKATAQDFVDAWEKRDYAKMYSLLSDESKSRTSRAEFRTAYASTAATATALRIRAGGARDPDGGVVEVPMTVTTRVWGPIKRTLRLPFEGSGEDARVNWSRRLTFPGVGEGETLRRDTRLPPRATLLARDGQVLARGVDRTTDHPNVAAAVVGEMGPMPPADRLSLLGLGYPQNAVVGVSGLEKGLEVRLAGRPGGTLSVGRDVIARSRPRAARPVRTTISIKATEAAINALGGLSGGIAVIQPRTGEVLGLSGTAYSATGPPGSTFKIVTTTAALQDRKVKLDDKFPVETGATLEGVRLANANDEACGGTFVESFAHSCNSVFAPLGAKVGKERLVETAEKFGFNERPLIPGAATSQIPQPSGIGDDLDVGSTAIGQGKVVASPLEMAVMAATVANRGARMPPHVLSGQRVRPVRVMTPALAATMRRLMIGVVKFGTATSADIEGVQVAGKTGTAELGLGPGQTDAWFVAFAPARNPRFAVAVWRLRAGAGGQASAPLAKQVLQSLL